LSGKNFDESNIKLSSDDGFENMTMNGSMPPDYPGKNNIEDEESGLITSDSDFEAEAAAAGF